MIEYPVFAYGSNMHTADLNRWLVDRGYPPLQNPRLEPAFCPDFRLVWNYYSPARHGGAANVEAYPGARVWGVLLPEDSGLRKALDIKEGHPHRYSRGEAPVRVRRRSDGRVCPAWVYEVQPAYRKEEFVAPRTSYVQLMLEACEIYGFDAQYRAELERLPTIP